MASNINSVNQSWDQIESFLKENDSAGYDALMNCEGITEKQLAIAQKALKYNLPDDLKSSLLRHDLHSVPSDDLKLFRDYGYGLNFTDMISSYRTYRGGPMATRFSDSSDSGEMDGLLPIFVYDEDRTYFFMSVDLKNNLVAYLDYGEDLVGKPTGRVVAWSFASYLSSLATNLVQGRYKYKGVWPERDFGFGGTEEVCTFIWGFDLDQILSFMPVARKLKFGDDGRDQDDDMDDYDMLSGVPLRTVIEEAVANPNSNLIVGNGLVPTSLTCIEAPKASSEEDLPPLPDVTLVDMRWEQSALGKDCILQQDGKVLIVDGVRTTTAYGDTSVKSGRNFWEILVEENVVVHEIGVSSRLPSQSPRWHITCGSYQGQLLGIVRSEQASCELTWPYPKQRFRKGDRVGVLVDMDQKTIDFYFNRQSMGVRSLKNMLDEMKESYGKYLTDPSQQEVNEVRPYVHGSKFKVTFNTPPK